MALSVHIKTLGPPPPLPLASPESCNSSAPADTDGTLLGLLLQAVCQQTSPPRKDSDLHLAGEGTSGDAARKLEMTNNAWAS